MAAERSGKERLGVWLVGLAVLLLPSCGAATATGGSLAASGGVASARAVAQTAPPTATALSVPYVPPSAAQTAQASFALTPHPTATATVIPTPTAIGAAVAFAAVERILVGNCAGCHPPNQNMNLMAGHVYASIVNVPSMELPSLMRVKPGDPAASYLYRKVSEAEPPVGARMPRNAPPLSADELTALRVWIQQGAKTQ